VSPTVSQHANCTLDVDEFSSLLQLNACAFMAHVAYVATGAHYLCNTAPEFIDFIMSLTSPG
jgi:hypothetical protein